MKREQLLIASPNLEKQAGSKKVSTNDSKYLDRSLMESPAPSYNGYSFYKASNEPDQEQDSVDCSLLSTENKVSDKIQDLNSRSNKPPSGRNSTARSKFQPRPESRKEHIISIEPSATRPRVTEATKTIRERNLDAYFYENPKRTQKDSVKESTDINQFLESFDTSKL